MQIYTHLFVLHLVYMVLTWMTFGTREFDRKSLTDGRAQLFKGPRFEYLRTHIANMLCVAFINKIKLHNQPFVCAEHEELNIIVSEYCLSSHLLYTSMLNRKHILWSDVHWGNIFRQFKLTTRVSPAIGIKYAQISCALFEGRALFTPYGNSKN